MNRNIQQLLILLVFVSLWTCKPISYQELVRNQSIREKTIVLRGGQQDSRGKSSIDDSAFVKPIRDPQLSNRPDPQPKVEQSQAGEQKLPKLKVRYATPDDGDPGGFGAGNSNEDFPEIPYPKNSISDPEFWNTIFGEETEDESTPAEQMPTTPPTKRLTRESVKKNDFVTGNIQPREFYDWEGNKRIIKSKELKNAAFSHGFEAETSGPKDLVECPIQPDPNKFQRENCSKVTDETVRNLSDKIVDVTAAKSKTIGRVKFEKEMPYYDSEITIALMDIMTGDCFFFHKNGKFWGYKKYTMEETLKLLPNVDVKWASDSSSPKFEL